MTSMKKIRKKIGGDLLDFLDFWAKGRGGQSEEAQRTK